MVVNVKVKAVIEMPANVFWYVRNTQEYLDSERAILKFKTKQCVDLVYFGQDNEDAYVDGALPSNLKPKSCKYLTRPDLSAVPPHILRMIASEDPVFMDIVQFDGNEDYSYHYQAIPGICPDQTSVHGKAYLEVSDNMVVLVMEAEIAVKVRFIGGLVEAIVVSGIKDGYNKIPETIDYYKSTYPESYQKALDFFEHAPAPQPVSIMVNSILQKEFNGKKSMIEIRCDITEERGLFDNVLWYDAVDNFESIRDLSQLPEEKIDVQSFYSLDISDPIPPVKSSFEQSNNDSSNKGSRKNRTFGKLNLSPQSSLEPDPAVVETKSDLSIDLKSRRKGHRRNKSDPNRIFPFLMGKLNHHKEKVGSENTSKESIERPESDSEATHGNIKESSQKTNKGAFLHTTPPFPHRKSAPVIHTENLMGKGLSDSSQQSFEKATTKHSHSHQGLTSAFSETKSGVLTATEPTITYNTNIEHNDEPTLVSSHTTVETKKERKEILVNDVKKMGTTITTTTTITTITTVLD